MRQHQHQQQQQHWQERQHAVWGMVLHYIGYEHIETNKNICMLVFFISMLYTTKIMIILYNEGMIVNNDPCVQINNIGYFWRQSIVYFNPKIKQKRSIILSMSSPKLITCITWARRNQKWFGKVRKYNALCLQALSISSIGINAIGRLYCIGKTLKQFNSLY